VNKDLRFNGFPASGKSPLQDPALRAARPLTAKGGIRAQTKSRKVGKNWWTKRWMAVLENHYMGAELPRGRAYAQAGQVLNLTIEQGEVNADVQGSTKKPYQVRVRFKAVPAAAWDKLARTLASKAVYAAKLLSGQMPEFIEEAFKEMDIPLFPSAMGDLQTTCSCPNTTNSPCKHVIAVYYLLAEEFDRDPVLFMKLRGLDRRKLVDSIGASKRGKDKGRKADYLIGDFHDHPLGKESALTENVDLFWRGGETVDESRLGDVRIPPTPGALSKHLGHFPLWRGEERFLDALELVYKKASQNGMNVFLGDW
jgi:uncharacterized Zn finger protein